MIRIFCLLLLVAGLFKATTVDAQFYLNQGELAEIMHECTPELERLPSVGYDYKVLYSSRNNSVLARATFYKVIGEGDTKKGRSRALLVALLNRKLMDQMSVGDTLVVPDKWDLDFCAYSPFPRFYAGGLAFDKLFIIDKSIQAWAAYESGRLARWGIVNTGDAQHRTPNGRFNFNWKSEYRVSSHSPPGEPWEMYWLFNFVEERGIHVHQYPFPSGGPMSHGCVRLVDEDAIWIYNWADGWKKGASGFKSSMGTISQPGTTVLVVGNDPPGSPTTFSKKGRTPKLLPVQLPGHPFDIAPGGAQQKYFDRIRRM